MTNNFLTDVYHLTRIPFELGRYDVERVGRQEEWKRLLQLIAGSAGQQTPRYIVLLGSYGSGKSFLLWQLYLHFGRSTRKILATKPIRTIEPEQGKDFIRSLVLRAFRRGWDLGDDLGPVVRAAKKKRVSLNPTLEPYAKIIFALDDDKKESLARRVLTGGKLLRGESELLGTPEVAQIRTSDEAMDLLAVLQVVCKWAGLDALVLSLDEVEYVDQLSQRQQGQVFDSLKAMWDHEVAFASSATAPDLVPLVFVLSATPSFWQSKIQLMRGSAKPSSALVGLKPFLDRVPEGSVVELPPGLEKDEARDLIISRMSEARDTDTPKTPIIPFTEDYIDYVFDLAKGVPRKIIEICETVVGQALRRKVQKITRAKAEEILRDLLIAYEPLVG